MNLFDIRKDYSQQELSETDCLAEPLEQFKKWLNEAIDSQVNEVTAMNIATIDHENRPNSRIVLLKEVDTEGFIFFTNYNSRKGSALALNPYAALSFFWPELERQIRIEGSVQKLQADASDEYFKSRPYKSQIGAWASEQSQVIPSKSELITRAAGFALTHPFHIPRPPHWGGYIVIPDRIEFWQGRPSRLHDRIQYRLANKQWIKERLAP